MSWYTFFRFLTGASIPVWARAEIEGRHHVPARGPFILVPNHQSVLDPILVQTSVARTDIYTLTKSTQFALPFFRWLLPRTQTVPVRRFRVDPQAVRVMLRKLDAGHGVCIYAEGERSWDGAIQPLRRGAVRVILKAGVPVIPCGVSGSFDVWPRWSRRPRRGEVRVRFGEPLEFGRHDERSEREARLEDTTATIRAALAELSGAPLAAGEAGPPARGEAPESPEAPRPVNGTGRSELGAEAKGGRE